MRLSRRYIAIARERFAHLYEAASLLRLRRRDQPTCKGFTRPQCKPCPNVKDVRPTSYDSMGEILTADLCQICRSRLLVGAKQAWA